MSGHAWAHPAPAIALGYDQIPAAGLGSETASTLTTIVQARLGAVNHLHLTLKLRSGTSSARTSSACTR
ncbi:hypothetical protein [Gordonia oryzae]|uniref:hypothetical protein n=1 Tax=Gordonia oryzae TaxID=2487349 RepID=UPI0026C6ECA9